MAVDENDEIWRVKLQETLLLNGETEADIIEMSGRENFDLSPRDCLDKEEGWLAWTKNRVYFPHIYDGGFYSNVYSVPRNPCKETFLKEN